VTIGHAQNAAANQSVPDLLHTGLTLIGMRVDIPANTTIGANVLVAPRTTGKAWINSTNYPDGSTITS
jgi:hypothetical protein